LTNEDVCSFNGLCCAGLLIEKLTGAEDTRLRYHCGWKGDPMPKIKRVYEKAEAGDGVRFLVERLWPRGIKKETLKMKAWLKDAAPSPDLRKWYGHDVARWEEFRQRYRTELENNPEAWMPILEAAREGNVTLLYSARDTEHNSARVLKEFLQEQ
jgi:uncharacterized protein YeaO (DUF488 family)